MMGKWWERPGPILFVDGAHDGPFWRMGGFSKYVGATLAVAVSLSSHN